MKHLPILYIILISITILSCENEENIFRNLMVNEFLAINDNCLADEYGEYDDWVEIYNNSNNIIDIGGLYITDKIDDSNPYMIPDSISTMTSIEPHGYIIIWCDRDIDQGPLHVNFKLSGNGEAIVLLGKDKDTVIDGFEFGPQTTDISMGRVGNDWVSFEEPTPGEPNDN